MKISLNWIKQYTDVDIVPQGVTELVEKIGAQLGAVEEVIDLGAKYKGVVAVRIVSVQDHPNADRLHVCKIDDAGQVQDIERDEDGYIQVVCGARNVRPGIFVAWLPPGSTVPESFDNEPFVLEVRPLRGVASNGMLASPRELALGEAHDGILEIDREVQPGTPFADVYGLNDTIIDIENKMFTHRPDCFGQLGVVREIVGIRGQSFYSPDWYLHALQDVLTQDGTSLPLSVRNELPTEVPRFMAIAMSDVVVGPSPIWLQSYLTRVGVRPINNVVDITNYMMLLTGQPLHAYDYDKVRALDAGSDAATLVVRRPLSGEKINLLNSKEIEPRAEAIMIAANQTLIGVGGVMGGADTEVDDNTKNIIVECATFDMYSIRRTAMAHGLFTDAVTRNNKGQSPLQNDRILAKAVEMLRTEASAQVASDLIDIDHLSQQVRKQDSLYAPVKVSNDFINRRLGLQISTQEMAILLTNVEFRAALDGDDLIVTAPFWRTDIEIAEDIVEEVGRLYGFDHLPLELPRRDLTPTAQDPMLQLKQRIRSILSAAGANEVLTYSFVHGNLLDKAGQQREQAFSLANALSPDLQYYRMSLTPSLLDKVTANIKAGYDHFALFELNKTHNLLHAADDQGLPTEFTMLSLVMAANDKKTDSSAGATFYEARTYLDHLAVAFGLELSYAPIVEALAFPVAAPFDHTRSALVSLRNGTLLGIVGEFKASVRKQLKLPVHSAGFEIDLEALLNYGDQGKRYRQLSRFPSVTQDICFKVPMPVSYQQLYDFVYDKLQAEYADSNSAFSLSPVDIFQRTDAAEHKQITLRLNVSNYQKTQRDTEVSATLQAVADAAKTILQAERI